MSKNNYKTILLRAEKLKDKELKELVEKLKENKEKGKPINKLLNIIKSRTAFLLKSDIN